MCHIRFIYNDLYKCVIGLTRKNKGIILGLYRKMETTA